MCTHCLWLAQLDECRMVSYCDHALLHIQWCDATLHLSPTDFMRMVRVLEEAIMEVNISSITDQQVCRLIQLSNGNYELWVKRVLFFLSPTEFFQFTGMMRKAARALKSHAAQQIQQQVIITQYQQYCPQIIQGDLFSVN